MRYLVRGVRLIFSPLLALSMAAGLWWAYVQEVCRGTFDADAR